MQVVRIVQSLTSAGPDDKLSRIENFRVNEGWKFEYPSAHAVFHSHGSLSLSLALFLSLFSRFSRAFAWSVNLPEDRARIQWVYDLIYRAISLAYMRAHVDTLHYTSIDSREDLGCEGTDQRHVTQRLSSGTFHSRVSKHLLLWPVILYLSRSPHISKCNFLLINHSLWTRLKIFLRKNFDIAKKYYSQCYYIKLLYKEF